MRHKDSSRDEARNSAPAAFDTNPETERRSSREFEFTPIREEVAHHAYLAYLEQGSRLGYDIQHWLTAEAQLAAESQLKPEQGFQNLS